MSSACRFRPAQSCNFPKIESLRNKNYKVIIETMEILLKIVTAFPGVVSARTFLF